MGLENQAVPQRLCLLQRKFFLESSEYSYLKGDFKKIQIDLTENSENIDQNYDFIKGYTVFLVQDEWQCLSLP